MLVHPSRHYIYYLFSKRALDVPTIVQRLVDLWLPVPTDEKKMAQFTNMLLAARQKMHFPAGYNPLDSNEGTEAFLRRWKIEGMWRHDPFVARAGDVLLAPPIRRMVEVLLLGPLSLADIARQVRERFALPQDVMNTRVISSFMHYYWDYGALNHEQWTDCLFYWMPGYNNDLLTALKAPRSPAGAALAIAAADRGGAQSLNPVAMYSAIRDQGFQMFMEHALNEKPSLLRTQGAMFALNIITQAEEQLDKRRGTTAELLEHLHKIETVYDNKKLRSVNDLPTIRESLPAVIDAEGEDVTPQENP